MVQGTQESTHPTSAARDRLYFHFAFGFDTLILAHMLDSLVRVSRRVDYDHFARISSVLVTHPPSAERLKPALHAVQAQVPHRQ